jgi:hypothetical protein
LTFAHFVNQGRGNSWVDRKKCRVDHYGLNISNQQKKRTHMFRTVNVQCHFLELRLT